MLRVSLIAQLVKNLPATTTKQKQKTKKQTNKKESACNAGYPSLISGLGRSPGEVIGYPPWVSLVAQLVKNLPAMWETWFQSLG